MTTATASWLDELIADARQIDLRSPEPRSLDLRDVPRPRRIREPLVVPESAVQLLADWE